MIKIQGLDAGGSLTTNLYIDDGILSPETKTAVDITLQGEYVVYKHSYAVGKRYLDIWLTDSECYTLEQIAKNNLRCKFTIYSHEYTGVIIEINYAKADETVDYYRVKIVFVEV